MSSSVVGSFGGSFFTWFQDEVLPYLLGTLYIIVLILGIVFNSILITTLRKRNMLDIQPNRFVLELAICDLISLVLFIFPAIIVAFMRDWKLSNYFCQVHGTLFTKCYIITFGVLIALGAERAVRAKNFDLHDKVYLRSKAVTWISILIWIIGFGIAIIPQTGWVTISYDFYQAACVPSFGNNVGYLSIVFVFGLGFCFIAFLISYGFIFSARKKKLEKSVPGDKSSGSSNLLSLMSKNKNENKKPESKGSTSSMAKTENKIGTSNSTSETLPSVNNAAPKIGWGSSSASANTNASSGAGKPKSKFAALNAREKMKKAMTRVKVSKLFSDDNSDPDFHLAVTYFIVACLMVFLWLPYFIIAFVSVSDNGLWGGYYTVVSVLAMLSYCLKPVIYLAHNRNYQSVTKETMPEKVIVKANKVRNSISEAMNKLDKVMFKSTPAQKKFNATLKTTIVAKGWLGRARKNLKAKGIGAIGNKETNGKSGFEMSSLKKIQETEDESKKTVPTKLPDNGTNSKSNGTVVKAKSVHSSDNNNNKQILSPRQSAELHKRSDDKIETAETATKSQGIEKEAHKGDNEVVKDRNVLQASSSISNSQTNKDNLSQGNKLISDPIAVIPLQKNDQKISSSEKKKSVDNTNNNTQLTSNLNAKNVKESNKSQHQAHPRLLQKRDSKVEFHYAHLNTDADSVPVIVNATDGFDDSVTYKPLHFGMKRSVYDQRETVNVLPSVSETTYVNIQDHNNTFPNNSDYNTSHPVDRVQRSQYRHQMSIDSNSSGQSYDNVFIPSKKPIGHANGISEPNQQRLEHKRRNTVSVPINSDVGNNSLGAVDPPYTDRNGFDPRLQKNETDTGYKGGRRNTYQPSSLLLPSSNKLSSRRASQIVDLPSNMNASKNPLPLDFV